MTGIDVLLTHSNHLFSDRKQVEKMQPYPPLQTLVAAAYLRSAGFTVALCDVTFDEPLETLKWFLAATHPSLLVVCEDDFNFLSKMCLARNRELAFDFARIAQDCGCTTAVHGPDSSDHVREYLDAGFRYVLVGEVEETLLELAAGHTPESIRGLAFRPTSGNRIQYNPRRPLRQDLEALPRAAWDLVDMHAYEKAWRERHGFFSLNMVSSRGCPFRCNWCAKPIYGDNYHVRSAQGVADEMLYLKHTFKPDHIWFADDIFALSPRWTAAFAQTVDRISAQIPFKMQSRCDLMTRGTVQALKLAGCAEVWMGAESGSQRVLQSMDKQIRVDQIYTARENLSRHGIRVGLFLQFGYPGETWDDIEATLRMVRETKPDDVGISVSYPLPGTKFYQLVSAQIGPKTQWSDSADLAMMFRGAYSTQFYRALAEAVHLEVRQPASSIGIEEAWRKVIELRDDLRKPAGVPLAS